MACAILALVGAASAAQAQVPGVTWTLGAATDYRSKGLSKSDDDGYAFAAVDWKSPDGLLYAGAAAATVDVPFGADYETDLKVGVRPKAAGVDFDFAVFYRHFGDTSPGADDDYVEYRAQASKVFGRVTVRALTWYTPDNAGAPEASRWSEARVTWKARPNLRPSVSLGAHQQENGPDYAAWNAGVAYDLTRKMELDLRWYDTDAHERGSRYDGEAVASLTLKL